MSMIFSPVGDSCLIEETTAQVPLAICPVTMLTAHAASTEMCFRSTMGAPPMWGPRYGPHTPDVRGAPGKPGRPSGTPLHSAGQRDYLALAAQSGWYSMPSAFIS